MYPRDIIVIGASADGLDALRRLTHDLPADLPASIFVVQHCAPSAQSLLPGVLKRSGPFKATHPMNHEPIRHGSIYIAPPDRHMLIHEGHVYTSQGPKENRSRPSIDSLFRSAARAYGPRVTGVILTGTLDDGTAGLLAVKDRGGIAVVQKPGDTAYPSMPASALRHVKADYCLPLSEIAAQLVQLVNERVEDVQKTSCEKLEIEYQISMGDNVAMERIRTVGTLSPFTCPECHSSMWELGDHGFIRFRCRMGHAYSAKSLIDEQSEIIENMLSSMHRARREQAELVAYVRTQEAGSLETLIHKGVMETSEGFMKPKAASAG